MTRNRAPGRKKQKPTPGTQEKQSSTAAASKTRRVIEIITLIGTVASILGGLAFIPRVSLEVSGSVRSQDPFGTVFSLSNESLLPIHDVLAICRVDDLRTPQDVQFQNIEIHTPESKAGVLSPAQKMTLGCQHSFDTHGRTLYAKATIAVGYRPDFLWWRRNIEFPMEALRGEDGTWIWKRIPQ